MSECIPLYWITFVCLIPVGVLLLAITIFIALAQFGQWVMEDKPNDHPNH
jgi:hypothetical protein